MCDKEDVETFEKLRLDGLWDVGISDGICSWASYGLSGSSRRAFIGYHISTIDSVHHGEANGIFHSNVSLA